MWTTSAFILKSLQEIAGVFHIIGIMRRLADYYLNRAPSWDEIRSAPRKFIRDDKTHIHFAHRERKDHRHSPQDVLRGVLARTVPTPTLARIFFATQCTRHLDRSGYIRFRRWRFYAEAGLVKQDVQVSISTSTRHPSSTRRLYWPFTPSPGTRTTSLSRKSATPV